MGAAGLAALAQVDSPVKRVGDSPITAPPTAGSRAQAGDRKRPDARALLLARQAKAEATALLANQMSADLANAKRREAERLDQEAKDADANAAAAELASAMLGDRRMSAALALDEQARGGGGGGGDGGGCGDDDE